MDLLDYKLDYKHPTISELHAIETKAHELRAEALRDGLTAVSDFVKSNARKIVTELNGRRQRWVGIRLEPTPPYKS